MSIKNALRFAADREVVVSPAEHYINVKGEADILPAVKISPLIVGMHTGEDIILSAGGMRTDLNGDNVRMAEIKVSPELAALIMADALRADRDQEEPQLAQADSPGANP